MLGLGLELGLRNGVGVEFGVWIRAEGLGNLLVL
jgi:hypothetical protein